jgi:hypothetical protein
MSCHLLLALIHGGPPLRVFMGDYHQEAAGLHCLACDDRDALDDASARSAELVLHLHGFDDE